MELRPYQENIRDKLREAVQAGYKKVLAQLETGGGKTCIFCNITSNVIQRNKTVFIVLHRHNLVQQTSDTLTNIGVPHSFIATGFNRLPGYNVYVCKIGTLFNRKDKISIIPDVLIIDEAHHATSRTWRETIDYYAKNGCCVLGFTATPERLDGKPLGDIFETMVQGVDTSWLIDSGYLSDYKIYGATHHIDLTGVRRIAGDFNSKDLSEVVDKPKIVGDCVAEYLKYAAGKRAICFCVQREHARHVAAAFNANGVHAEYLAGDSEDQDGIIQRYSAGTTLVLCAVDLISEGFDVPLTECVILERPTESFCMHRQQIGRALRPAEGKSHAIILDHVGNCARHGVPDDIIEWSLDKGKKGRQKKQMTGDKTRQCPGCFRVHSYAPQCPYCGHTYEVVGREIEQVDGELVEMQRQERKVQRREEIKKLKTEKELLDFAIKQGYTWPYKWAEHYMKATGGAKRWQKE